MEEREEETKKKNKRKTTHKKTHHHHRKEKKKKKNLKNDMDRCFVEKAGGEEEEVRIVLAASFDVLSRVYARRVRCAFLCRLRRVVFF